MLAAGSLIARHDSLSLVALPSFKAADKHLP